MQSSLTRTFTDSSTQTFIDRCHSLGLACYQLNTDGSVSCVSSWGDEASAPASAWLTDARVLEQISSALSGETPSEGYTEIDRGVFLLPIPDPQGHRRPMGLVAFGEVAFSNSPLKHETAQITRYQTAQLSQLAQTLTWNLADLRRVDQGNFAAEDLTEQLGQNYENITLLYRLGRSMSSIDAPEQIAQSVCNQLLETQDFGWVAAYFRADGQEVPGLAGQCLMAGDMPGDTAEFQGLLEQMICDWESDRWSNLLQVGEDDLATLARSEVILDPIQHDGRVIGAVVAGGKTGVDPEATSSDTQLVDAIAAFLGTFHENAARFHEQQMMFIGTLEAVSTALDAKDRYTFGHSERVAHLAVQLSRAIGLEEQEVERIRIAGLVHDVGKIGVPEAVLCKTGKLTDEEYEQIKRHPRIGHNILKGIPKMEDVLDGVLYHHERWDGRGYPEKLGGEDIPLYGRILAVADTFDAMSSTRSYRQAMPRHKVLEEILRCAGSQFDPRLTGPFVALDFSEFDKLVAHHEGLAGNQAA